MSEPSKKSSPFSRHPENVLVYVERLRQQAEEFKRAVEDDLRATACSSARSAHARGARRDSAHRAGVARAVPSGESRAGMSGAQLFVLRTVAESPGLSLNELTLE
jgi:hypothetical protein